MTYIHKKYQNCSNPDCQPTFQLLYQKINLFTFLFELNIIKPLNFEISRKCTSKLVQFYFLASYK